ncbi:MAG: glycosyltransferase [Anaerolineaceae bacterium]|nr:glycosyltransferase [Anaerolineaceae bacterium]
MSSDRASLLISFCNQISSPDFSLCIFDISDRSSRWIDFSGLSDDFRNSFSGVCGICVVAEDVIIATQGASPVLASVSIAEAKVTNYVALTQCKDPHSLVCSNGFVYVVSTGTNEIYRVPFEDGQFGAEELFWSYPGVCHERDEVHLNGLTVDGDDLIASCFGPRNAEGSWGMEGRVFHVDSGISIRTGLNQPHSPIVSGALLAFAESAASKVHIFRKTDNLPWISAQEILLSGYTRGLVLREHQLLVGVSANRKLSRSQGKFLYENQSDNVSKLLSIDLATGETDANYGLVAYGREPYDLFEINKRPNLLGEADSINARIRNMESWSDRYTADIGSLFRQISGHKTSSHGLVSVIIPTYNRAHLIGESIRSVLSQTYFDLEIIVVDDGSTDNTEEVIAAISDSRLRYILQPNRGRSNARNHALSLASGKYVTFLDSDDLYLPNKIELQVNYLESHPGVGMVYTSAHCINAVGEMLTQKYTASVSGLIYESIAFFTPVTITLPTVMTYKNVMDHVGGFDEQMHRFEDTDMWRRISKFFRIDAMPEYTCLLRTHDDNSLLNQNPAQIATALDYYAAKIINEDLEIDIVTRKMGLAGLYEYYGNALASVPQFSVVGKKLIQISNAYESTEAFSVKSLVRFAYRPIVNLAKRLARRIKRSLASVKVF